MFSRIGLSLILVLALAPGCKDKKAVVQNTTPPPSTIPPPKPGTRNDLRIVVHEELINKVIAAIGPISATEDYKALFVKGKYTWTVVNPQIRLRPGKADFISDVKVNTGKRLQYVSSIIGSVDLKYDSKKNQISVGITKAIFEVYTKVFGRKVHIKDVDLAKYFTEPFVFEGPAGIESDMDFTMPDNSIRKLWMKTTDCDLLVEDKQIVVPCEMSFSQKK